MALPHTRRAPQGGRARRPEDAPPLRAVPETNEGEALPQVPPVAEPLPVALARAVKTPENEGGAGPGQARQEHEQDGAESGPGLEGDGAAGAPGRKGQVAVVAEGRSAAEAARALTWLGVTYRPPDVWRERQPSLAEEWAFAMDGSHLPEQGPWRVLARIYAAPALALIALLHGVIWVLRSPARHATAWVVVAVLSLSAVHML